MADDQLTITPGFAERFWAKVLRTEGCWEWQGATTNAGYGKIHYRGSLWLATRAIWTELHGPIPDGLRVLHRCDNPPCVRPDRLFLGTPRDNVEDMHAKGREPRGDAHWSRRRPEWVLRGEANGSARIGDEAAQEMRRRYASGAVSQRQLAAEAGISQQQVSKIIRGERRGHAGIIAPADDPLAVEPVCADPGPFSISGRDRDRFWSHVQRSADCWLWTGMLFDDGYGQIRFQGRNWKTHRLSWCIEHGYVPRGLCVCHTCDVRPCVRPEHLVLGTRSQNSRDMVRKGRHRNRPAGDGRED